MTRATRAALEKVVQILHEAGWDKPLESEQTEPLELSQNARSTEAQSSALLQIRSPRLANPNEAELFKKEVVEELPDVGE